MAPELAAGIRRVKGAKRLGVTSAPDIQDNKKLVEMLITVEKSASRHREFGFLL
jgi:hypothetical protein